MAKSQPALKKRMWIAEGKFLEPGVDISLKICSRALVNKLSIKKH